MAVKEIEQFKYEAWLNMIIDSFAAQGYKKVTTEDLWDYCVSFLWKHKRPERYHEEVKDIMAIKPNDYFTYASLKAQVYNVSSLEEMNLDDLF